MSLELLVAYFVKVDSMRNDYQGSVAQQYKGEENNELYVEWVAGSTA